jgi:uncharacterized RDD family membrane protein YckC
VPGIPAGVEIGGLGRRLVARILDGLVLGPVYLVIAVMTWDSDFGAQTLGTLVQSVIAFAYDSYFLTTRGRTLGKGWMGLRVVQLANGQRPDQTSSMKRAALYNFSWIACYIGSILVALSPVFDGSGRRQGWHDKFAGTVVIKG